VTFYDAAMRFDLAFGLLVSQWLVGWWIGLRSVRLPEAAGAAMAFAVVIPARNEAHVIGDLVAALQRQSVPPAELIVVDDHSTDDTAVLAAAAGAHVIAGAALPDGWNGKTWACQQGADASTAPVLVFLDADVSPGATLLAKLADVVREGALVSVQPRHIAPRFSEGTAAACNVFALQGAGVTGIIATPPARMAFGPCLATTRATYDAIGGHAAVRAAIPEDLALAQRARAAGIPVRAYVGGDDISFRMYPDGFGAMVRGFARNLAGGMAATRPLRLLAVVWWIIGLVGAWITLAQSVGSSTPAVLIAVGVVLAFTVQWAILIRTAGAFGAVNRIVYLVPLAVFFWAVARSLLARAMRTPVQWRGRDVALGTDVSAQ
jgi:hypothetical protein